ncbi:MAG: hypothetical protein R3A10_05535 [Caldilineaceae bacterium]
MLDHRDGFDDDVIVLLARRARGCRDPGRRRSFDHRACTTVRVYSYCRSTRCGTGADIEEVQDVVGLEHLMQQPPLEDSVRARPVDRRRRPQFQ